MGGAGAAAVGAFRRLCGGAPKTRGDGPGLSRLPVAGRDRGVDAATRTGGATPTARRSTPAPTATSTRPRRSGGLRPARPMRSVSAPPRRRRKAGPLTWHEAGAGPDGRDRDDCRRSARLGRLHPRAERDADQLPPLRRGRRCGAGRDPCRPRPRPVPCHGGACAPAAAPRPADAGLPPSRAHQPTRAAGSCPSRTATPASARCARPGRRWQTSGASSGSTRRSRRRGEGSCRSPPFPDGEGWAEPSALLETSTSPLPRTPRSGRGRSRCRVFAHVAEPFPPRRECSR